MRLKVLLVMGSRCWRAHCASGSDRSSEGLIVRRILIRLLVLAGVAAAAVAAPAVAATPPEQITEILDTTRTETRTCGFPITWQTSATVRYTVFLDDDGMLDRVIEKVSQAEVTVTANGVMLRSAGAGATIIEFTAGGVDYFVTHGLSVNLIVPGVGPVFVEAGRSVYLVRPLRRIFEAGVTIYDPVALCAALAGT